MSVTKICEKTLGPLDIKVDVDGSFGGFFCVECGRDLTHEAHTYYYGKLVCFACYRKLEIQEENLRIVTENEMVLFSGDILLSCGGGVL